MFKKLFRTAGLLDLKREDECCTKSDEMSYGFTSQTPASIGTKGLTDGALEGPGGKPWTDGR